MKPNRSGSPSSFDAPYVAQQLRHSGAMTAIAFRKEGFSHRLTFAEFLRR